MSAVLPHRYRQGRLVFALGALLALVVLVAGCGGSDELSLDEITSGKESTAGSGSGEGSKGPDESSGSGNGGKGSDGGGDGDSGGSEPGPVVRKAEDFGSEVGGSQAKQVEASLLGYLKARARGEWAKACSYLAKDFRRLFGKFANKTGTKGCVGFVAQITERLSPDERAELADIEVESVRVKGDSGYILYTDPKGNRQTKPVEEEGGAWKVSSVLAQFAEKNK